MPVQVQDYVYTYFFGNRRFWGRYVSCWENFLMMVHITCRNM